MAEELARDAGLLVEESPGLAAVLLEHGIALAVAVVLRWIVLMAVMWLVRWFADLTIPETRDFLRQTLVIAAICAPTIYLPWLVGVVVCAAATGTLMRRWFDADLSAVLFILVLTFVAEWALAIVAAGALGILEKRPGG